MKDLDMLIVEGEFNELESRFIKVLSDFNKLTEDVTQLSAPSNDLLAMFDEASKRFEAARRGIGITNRMPAGPERQQHRARIMANLNRLRALVDRIVKKAETNSFSLGQEQRMTQNRNMAV